MGISKIYAIDFIPNNFFKEVISLIVRIYSFYLVLFNQKFSYPKSNSSYSDLLQELDAGKVQSLYFYPKRREIDVIFKNGE